LSYVTENAGRFGINPKGGQLEEMAPPPKLKHSATVKPKIKKTLGQTQVERGGQKIDQEKTVKLKQTMGNKKPCPPALPPKPLPANAKKQPAERGRQKKPSGTPSGSKASTQSQIPPATSTPQEQPPRPGSSPTRKDGKGLESVHEQNLQTRRPPQQESNA